MFDLEGLIPGAWHGLILQLHLVATCIMVGVIWFVQHVHYPLKSYVHEAHFSDYQSQHMQRTAHIVGIPMLAEAGLAALLLLDPAIAGQPGLALLNCALLVGVWVCTALFQVPQHEALSLGFEATVHRLLVRTNWLRTALWSARAACAVLLLG
jgi:hypothetical protein